MVQEAMWNKEFSGWSANHDEPVKVNSEVDPSIMVTDPVNPDFTPQNKTEFGVAVNQLVKNLSDSEMPQLFNVVKSAIDTKAITQEDEDMKSKAVQGGSENVEETLRRHIRKMLSEADLPPVKKIPFGVHGGEAQRHIDKSKDWLRRSMGKAIDDYEKPAPEEPVNPEDPTVGDGVPDAPGKRKAYKSSALGAMDDIDYDEDRGEREPMSFVEIAKELGFSVAGAKQAVDKALEKAQFLARDMDEDDREILILTAMSDYIDKLNKSGELNPADVQLMKDHPEIVRDLDGFREYLHNVIRKARNTDQKVLDIRTDDPDEVGDDDAEEAEEIADAELGEDGEPKKPVHYDLPDVPVGESRVRNRPVLYLTSPSRKLT